MIFQQILNEETGCLSYLIGCSQAGRAASSTPAATGSTTTWPWRGRRGCDHRCRRDPRPRGPRLRQPGAGGPLRGRRSTSIPRQMRPTPTPRSRTAPTALGSPTPCDAHSGPHPRQHLPPHHRSLPRRRSVVRPDRRHAVHRRRRAARLRRRAGRCPSVPKPDGAAPLLPDSVEIYPAHGAGSSCGRAMSSKTASTIGFERRFNSALAAEKPTSSSVGS